MWDGVRGFASSTNPEEPGSWSISMEGGGGTALETRTTRRIHPPDLGIENEAIGKSIVGVVICAGTLQNGC